MAVRVLSVMMGLWLFVSAFLWPHRGPVALSTWIPGLLITAVALAALVFPPVRLANALLGLWVLVAAVASGADDLVWNNGIVGLTVAVAAFVPTLPRGWGEEPRLAPARARS